MLWLLASLALAYALGLAYLTLWYRPAREGEALAFWERELSTRTEMRKMGIERWLAEALADAKAIASSPSTREIAVAQLVAGGGGPNDHLSQVLESWLPIEGVRSALLVDSGARRIVLAGPGPASACLEAAREVLPGGADLGDGLAADDGSPIAVFAARIRAADGGRLLGASVVSLDPRQWLYPFLAGVREVRGGSAEALLVRQNGDSVSFLSPLAYDRRAVPWTLRGASVHLPAQAALDGHQGFGAFSDERDEPVLAVTRALNHGRWGLVVKIDESEALAEIEERLLQDRWHGGLLILAFGLMAAAVAHGVDRSRRMARAESRAEVAMFLDQADDAILIATPEGALTSANRRAREIYGLPEGDLQRPANDAPALRGRSVADLRPEAQRGEAALRLAQVRRGGRLSFEAVHLKADGSPFPVEVSSRLTRWAGQDAIVSIVRDISARKRDEEALLASEARYRLLADNASDVIWTLDLATRRFTYVSPSVHRLRGFTPDEVMAQPLEASMTSEQGRALLAELERAVAGLKGGDLSWVSRAYEVDLPRRDGTTVSTEIVTSFILDESGQPVTLLGVTRDLTERRSAEALVRRQSAHLQAVLESPEEPVFAVDAGLRYTSFNQAHVAATRLVYGRTIALGETVLEAMTDPEDREHARSNFERALAGERFIEERTWGDTQHDRRYFDVSYNPIRTEAGPVIGVAVFAIDRTEVHRAEAARGRAEEDLRLLAESLERRVAERTAELEQANRELEAFSYSVSHDLRAPLRAIDGFSRILQEDHPGLLRGEPGRLHGLIRDNATRMGQLIDDLLAFSRVGRCELRRARVQMRALAESVYQELTAGQRRRARFEAGELPDAFGDPALLRQVLANLLANALKFSSQREQPEIALTGHLEDGHAVYMVRDDGVGFDMKHADKLFGVFQRLHGREFEGTGVGLALVERIVARHGGRVWAEGRVGEGATFFFALPLEGVLPDGRPRT